MFVQWDWERNPADDEPYGLRRDEILEALVRAGLLAIRVDVAFDLSVDGGTMRPLMGIGQKAGRRNA